MRASWSVAIAALAIALVTHASSAHAQLAGDPRMEPEEVEMLGLINTYRAQNGLGPLTPSAVLNRAAHDHSMDMAARGYFEHVSPEGRSPFDRMRAAGYPGGSMGENLAAGNDDAASTLVQWRRSPPHNEALLDGDYRAAGLGRVCAPGSEYECYWTLNLGSTIDSSAFALPAASAPRDGRPAAPADPAPPPGWDPAPRAQPPAANPRIIQLPAAPRATARPRVAPAPRAVRGAHQRRRARAAAAAPASPRSTPAPPAAATRRRVIVVDIPVD